MKSQSPKESSILKIAFYTLLLLNGLAFFFHAVREPHGGWDAWGIWNLKARFLFRGASHWQDALSPLLEGSHPDYPWLLPATIATLWHLLGRETTVVPNLVSFFFTFGTVGLLFFGLKKITNKTQAYMGGIVLMGTPIFMIIGWSQMADIPLAFFFLATFLLFCLHDVSSAPNQKLLILAGFTASLGLWTKNEGILFVLALFIARIRTLKEMLFFSLGLAPLLFLLLYFKTFLAPPNDILAGIHFQTILNNLLEPSRHLQILGAFYKQLGDRIWNWFPLFLIFYALVLKTQIEKNLLAYFKTSSLAILIQLAGYYSIYLLTPRELTWHLNTSLYRLLLQLWPSFLFNYFLVVSLKTPSERT